MRYAESHVTRDDDGVNSSLGFPITLKYFFHKRLQGNLEFNVSVYAWAMDILKSQGLGFESMVRS